MKTILCFGDSNTYGYDPADQYTYSYPESKRWTSVAGDILGNGYRIINEGLNGRLLPDMRYHSEYVESLASELAAGDIYCMMLGTNDLLMQYSPDAKVPARRLEAFLEHMKPIADEKSFSILIIAPVPIGRQLDGDDRYYDESIRMNEMFGNIAGEFGVLFADAALWQVELAFDKVHLSEKGHEVFGRRFADLCYQIYETAV